MHKKGKQSLRNIQRAFSICRLLPVKTESNAMMEMELQDLVGILSVLEYIKCNNGNGTLGCGQDYNQFLDESNAMMEIILQDMGENTCYWVSEDNVDLKGKLHNASKRENIKYQEEALINIISLGSYIF